MPSSSDAVATRTFSSPRFKRCSALRRSSLAMLPWCAVTCSAPSRSDKWRAARSAMRRVLTKMSVVRCASAISRAYVPGVDDDAIVALAALFGLACSDQKAGDLLDGLLRRGQADAHRR